METRLSAKQALHRFDSDLGLKNSTSYFLRSHLILEFTNPIMREPATAGFYMNWKIAISNWATRVLKYREYPVILKELAWKLAVFAAKCGRSNPLSFALRPLFYHNKLRFGVGIGLAIFSFSYSFVQPTSSLAIGGNSTLEVRPFGETVVTTLRSIQIPLKKYTVSQGFWWLHPGIDMASPVGEPVRPVMKGKVLLVERGRRGYGNHIIIKHGTQYESLYAHLSKTLVKEGDEVDLDTIIGEVGSTGRSTGPHLHLEIHADEQSTNPTSLLFK